ncbi:DUF4395 domain-containing protein [Microbacterium terricola]|uniref:DUF4395 domain-containing protein n=1 Tax=Microbacterium terricola TaxID=344163 RepID=A0ABM8DXL6_9MICO|nr:DUF4395 domain-containing protein [Microbacterium terricola]UYK39046.1 DUF4395 domain-containing protein [Microbacterium terricola]BDV30246.1 hypothetical protein Microterr_09060 [Microbacterium terricola]
MSDRTPAAPRGIDPRGPRFAAGITALLLLVAVFLGLTGLSTSDALGAATVAERAADPGFLLLLVIALLFLWSVLSPRTAPWGALYRAAVQPRLAPPAELEDPRPPRFAQGVGLLVSSVGLILHLLGVPWALPVAAAAAFIAAFLNAAFGLCLGCQLYLLLQRAGLVGRERAAV